MKFPKLTVSLIAVFLISLSACGGGGGSGSSDTADDPGNQSQPGETVINGKA
jgi:hypothetical protein